jgi:RND family efflux transporter MFP subunit
MWRRKMLGMTFMVAAVTALIGCGAPHAEAPAAAPERPSGLLEIEERATPDYRTVAAVLTNRDIGDARARIGGTLQRLLVHEGDTVRRGQVVAVIVDRRSTLEAQAGAAGVAAAEAQAERARGDFARAQFLFERGVYAQARMDAVQAETRAAEALLRAARAQHGALAEASNQGRVLAPADGRVTRAIVPEGAVVMPGEVIVGIATGARVLRIDLPEAEARNITLGSEIRILTEDETAPPRLARVRQVYPAIESGRVVADLDASGFEDEFVGMRVRILVPAGEREAIVIPASYLTTRYGVDYVRLTRAGGGVIDAPVQRGARVPMEGMPDGVEILSGLRPGDAILPAEPLA